MSVMRFSSARMPLENDVDGLVDLGELGVRPLGGDAWSTAR